MQSFSPGDPVRGALHPDGEEFSGDVESVGDGTITVRTLGGLVRVIDRKRDTMVLDHARRVLLGRP